MLPKELPHPDPLPEGEREPMLPKELPHPDPLPEGEREPMLPKELPHPDPLPEGEREPTFLNGSGKWHAEQAWLGRHAANVLIEVEGGRIKSVEEDTFAPHDATLLRGWTIPGMANAHSHAFQRLARGEIESGGGDFWEWRDRMYRFTDWLPADYFKHARLVFREMLEAGITAVGEFHYLHGHG